MFNTKLDISYLDVHSVDVRQVPMSPLVAVQASLGNFTTENRARDSLFELFVGTAAMDAPKPDCLCYDLMSQILTALPNKIKIFILFEEVQPRLLRDHWEESGKRQDPRSTSSSTFLPAPSVPRLYPQNFTSDEN